MTIDKQRQELYKTIWNIANKLRGSVEGWYFKDYVLGFLFYKYISEDFADCVREKIIASGDQSFKYEECEDDEDWIEGMKSTFIETKGYFIYPSHLFVNVRKASQIKFDNLNETLEKIFREIEDSTRDSGSRQDFEGLFKSIELNSDKLGKEVAQRNRKLKDILDELSNLNIQIEDADVFGDAYEYLIAMYASNAGKSGGEFYTPPEVSRLLKNLACEGMKDVSSVYDPACGSGSLLLKFVEHEDVELYGQEINLTTYNLCRMNMFLHGVNFSKFDIRYGDTLTQDYFTNQQFDVVVSNPPYSIKWEGKDNPELRNDKRFYRAGALAPKSNADFAFIQHSLFHLKEHGTAAIVCFPGILYRERAEKDIRKWLVENNHVDAIIQLPDKLFYGTGITTCIMTLKKSKPETEVMFIDASEFFEKAKNRNILSEDNITKIMQIYRDKKDVENVAKLVSAAEIKEREYNLSVDAYVVKNHNTEEIDIEELNKSIAQRSERINKLRQEIDSLIKELTDI